MKKLDNLLKRLPEIFVRRGNYTLDVRRGVIVQPISWLKAWKTDFILKLFSLNSNRSSEVEKPHISHYLSENDLQGLFNKNTTFTNLKNLN